jgi:hypothetical protein
MADDLTDTIATNATKPQFAQGDQGAMRQFSIKEQIAADRYAKGEAQLKTTNRGFFMTKLRPPGTA